MSESAGARDRISALVESNPVMLFMKGTPTVPQCGFSAQVLAILDHLSAGYATFDVLGDAEVREGVKEYSSWPTIPQLYIHGEFVGGCDIVREMYETGELQRTLAGSESRASS